MRKSIRLFNHVFEFSTGAKLRFNEVRWFPRNDHKNFISSHYRYDNHLVWWKFSFIWGQGHLEPIEVHKGCGAEVNGIGEDGISYCTGCEHVVEGDTETITMEEYEARA